jgi:hypothetical protein
MISIGIPNPSFPRTNTTLSGNSKSYIFTLFEVYSRPTRVYPVLFLNIK